MLTQSTAELITTAPLTASHGVFSGRLANQAGRVRVPPLRDHRRTPGVPRRDSTFTAAHYTPGSPLSISPDSFAQRTKQTEPANTETNGHDQSLDSGLLRGERRRRPSPSSPEEYLRALPGIVLLDRLPVPMLATGLDGVVVYVNPAFATMLGHHPDNVMLTGLPLPALLAGHSATPPRDCVTALRAASNVIVDWLHVEGFPVRSVISETLFLRASDEILLIGVTDITELVWTTPPEPG
ncbi:PAS domain-containing protein [Mycobacterium sp.]|uniref:PAS domain-containing protein n=1 Tax=Mycobacterium sp. TaxID=1785 RepID=UPI003BAF94F2